MARLIKLLFFLAFFGVIGLIAYAYVAPIFGVDFAPEAQEIRHEITLEVD